MSSVFQNNLGHNCGMVGNLKIGSLRFTTEKQRERTKK